ncbi:MAG TPA: hypothetical protein ENK06_04475 [Gammaproteobacteria bacterium]|nr:hypothetical protein [Gammaproteobacteria bacterium]
MSEDKKIVFQPAELSLSENLTADKHLKVFIAADLEALDRGPAEIFVVRNDANDKWWVVDGDLEETLLVWDINKVKASGHVLYGPFDELDAAKSAALLHLTQLANLDDGEDAG